MLSRGNRAYTKEPVDSIIILLSPEDVLRVTGLNGTHTFPYDATDVDITIVVFALCKRNNLLSCITILIPTSDLLIVSNVRTSIQLYHSQLGHTSGSFCDHMCSNVFPACERKVHDTSTSSRGRTSTIKSTSFQSRPVPQHPTAAPLQWLPSPPPRVGNYPHPCLPNQPCTYTKKYTHSAQCMILNLRADNQPTHY